MPLRDLILTISVPFLWGIGFVLTKKGMEQFPPMLINSLRWGLTGLILVWWFPIPKKFLKQILIISFIGCTVQYSLTFSGLNIIDASSAVLFVQCEVPFGVLIAFFYAFIYIMSYLITVPRSLGSFFCWFTAILSPIFVYLNII